MLTVLARGSGIFRTAFILAILRIRTVYDKIKTSTKLVVKGAMPHAG